MTTTIKYVTINIYGMRQPFAAYTKKDFIMGNSKEISVFCCANSYDKLAVMRSLNLQDTKLNIISLPCSGKLDILYMVKTFEAGVDGAVVMMCGEG